MQTETARTRPTQVQPDLSIIVLTYNRAAMLRHCLDSLLAQAYPAERLEIIVADDGSSDGTTALVEGYAEQHGNVKHVRHAHRGIPATRNLGLRNARGALVAIVADDYILDPSYADTIVSFFRDHPHGEIVRFDIVPAANDLGSRISHAYYRASVLRRLTMSRDGGGSGTLVEPPRELTTQHGLDASGAAGFRREVFERVGLFDESLARAEDSDLTARLRRHGIAIYFDPNHPVRHQYDRYLRDTLMKSWLTGRYRYHHCRKNAPVRVRSDFVAGFLRDKLLGLRIEWREARREGAVARFFLALPFTLLFEIVNKSGFVASWMMDRSNRRAAQAQSVR